MTRYEMRKYWLIHQLETYRDTPPKKRGFVDWLINFSKEAAGERAEEKKLHNFIVLRYITDTKPTKTDISKALHMSRNCYEENTERAIERLLVLAFGVNGIDWNNAGEKRA